MYDVKTGKLLRTMTDVHAPGTAVLHVKVSSNPFIWQSIFRHNKLINSANLIRAMTFFLNYSLFVCGLIIIFLLFPVYRQSHISFM